MTLVCYQVDAFAEKLFGGNSACVVPVKQPLSQVLMQAIAMENNVSETAFVEPIASGKYYIRWFSPLQEIKFCGHATLASAFVLFRENSAMTQIEFQTDAVGVLTATKTNDLIELSFPIRAPEPVFEVPEALKQGLSLTSQRVY